MRYWLRDLLVNNRFMARRRWKKLPEDLRDRITTAMMEPREELIEDPDWPGIKFTPQAHETLQALREIAGDAGLNG